MESNLTKNYNIDVKSPNYEDYEYEHYEVEDYPKPNTRVEHDTILKITCSSKPELTSSLTCKNGTWTGLPPSCLQGKILIIVTSTLSHVLTTSLRRPKDQ